MKKGNHIRLVKIIEMERNNIVENQDGLDFLDNGVSVDKAVLHNLSTKLSCKDLKCVCSIMSHYINDGKGHINHIKRKRLKIELHRLLFKSRHKQKANRKRG